MTIDTAQVERDCAFLERDNTIPLTATRVAMSNVIEAARRHAVLHRRALRAIDIVNDHMDLGREDLAAIVHALTGEDGGR